MNRYVRQFKLVFNDENEKKGILQMLREIIVLSYKKKEPALFYGGKFLYRKNIHNYKDYLSVKEMMRLKDSLKLQKPEYVAILSNKLSFALYCKKHDLETPAMLSYNFGKRFYYKNQLDVISDRQGVVTFFRKVFADSGVSKVFIKVLTAKGGKGCYLLTQDNIEEQVNNIKEDIFNVSFIHQRVIVQHPEIDKVHSGCINSLRFITYIDKKGDTHIVSALMRFGSGKSAVDNASSGGFYVAIDLKTGRLQEAGHQFMHGGGNLIQQHPDTGYTFKDFKIPFFEESCALVLRATHYMPTRWIGWDIAIQPDGPTLIEGNETPGMLTADIAYGGYLGHPLVREAVGESRFPNHELMNESSF